MSRLRAAWARLRGSSDSRGPSESSGPGRGARMVVVDDKPLERAGHRRVMDDGPLKKDKGGPGAD